VLAKRKSDTLTYELLARAQSSASPPSTSRASRASISCRFDIAGPTRPHATNPAGSVRKPFVLRTLADPARLTHNEKSLAPAQAPTNENRTLPRRLPNAAYRPREYLTEPEVELLIDAARKRGRNGARDACAILMAYRHRIRASELAALRRDQIDLRHGCLHVNRAKGGCTSVHPLAGPELRALRPLQGSGLRH
jgi:integrase